MKLLSTDSLDKQMNRRILRLAGPSILANITVPLVGMVDLAIAGRLGDVASLGGIAIGTMLFDLLYWNMGFLRVGTGGYTAQAYGRRDFPDAMKIFIQAIGTALVAAMFIILIQYPFLEISFKLMDASPDVEQLARTYFSVRIWAAPATLSLFAFKGWFIGMQNTLSPMVTDIAVNLANLILSIFFAIGLKMDIGGIALGTVVAQYIGLCIAIAIMIAYYRKLFCYICIKASFKLKDMKKFFVLNGNLFLRSLGMMLIYSGFTVLATKYGNTLLAVSTIMMKLMLLYSYFIDGFAYAGEAVTGRYIGAMDLPSLKRAIRLLFYWALSIAVLSTLAYGIAGEPLFRLMTSNETVIAAAAPYMKWLLIVPVISCIAFTWDGIYIGATASAAIRNTVLLSAAVFLLVYYFSEPHISAQALYVAYAAHLIVRSCIMTLWAKKKVIAKAN